MFPALDSLIQLDAQEKEKLGVVYTPQEIARQPEVWLKVKEVMRGYIQALREFVGEGESIILTGAGSSYFAGKCVEAALAVNRQVSVQAIPSTEILMDPESTLPAAPFTLVSFARSGNSPEGNAVFQLAQRLRAGKVRQVVFTCNEAGELARLARQSQEPAFLCLLPPDTNDAGLAMTSSFTSMVVAALAMGSRSFAQYEEAVQGLAEAARRLLRHHGTALKEIAGLPFERVFFVGSRPFYGAALESHLKVQEMTDGQVIGKAEDTLGLRHGPMAAVNARTLVILFASAGKYRRQYETDLLRELADKQLGLARVVVCSSPAAEWDGLCDYVLDYSSEGSLRLGNDVLAPVLVIPAQVLGLFKSLDLGLSPDTPSRDKVINRVVEGVTIYPYGK